MFTKTQIEEIARKLAAMGKKDSQFKIAENLNGSEYFTILQNNENKRASLGKLIDYIGNNIAEDVIKKIEEELNKEVTLTVVCNVPEAEIMLNNEHTSTITVNSTDLIVVNISADGYIPFNGITCLHKSQTVYINLIKKSIEPTTYYNFSIDATPEDSTIIINNEERNSISVTPGTEVSWRVSRYGYVTQEGTEIVNRTISKAVSLEKENYTVTVAPTPSDATVKINGSVRTSITVPYNTEIDIEVSKTGYTTVERKVIVTRDETIAITLLNSQVTLTINPTPSDATVEINNQLRKSITVNVGDSVNIKVYKDGYESFEEDYIVNNTETKDIVLQKIVEVSWSNLTLKQADSSENTISSVPNSGGEISLTGEVDVTLSDGSSNKKDVTSYINWSVDGIGCTSNGNGNFTWDSNSDADPRSATIKGTLPKSVSPDLIEEDLESNIITTQVGSAEFIDLSPNELFYEAVGGSKTLTINSNSNWTLS